MKQPLRGQCKHKVAKIIWLIPPGSAEKPLMFLAARQCYRDRDNAAFAASLVLWLEWIHSPSFSPLSLGSLIVECDIGIKKNAPS